MPIPTRSKKPEGDGWQDLRVDHETAEQYFDGEQMNVGVLLGDKYGSCDVDLDCLEARRVAPTFLPPTGMIFGRKSAPASHYFFRSDPRVKIRKYNDPLKPTETRDTLVELRGTCADGHVGLQTVVPWSLHESGEWIQFESGYDRTPGNVDAPVLVRAVEKIAAAALLARYWPAPGHGRHYAMNALAGVLGRGSWPLEEAQEFCRALYGAITNPDPSQMQRSDGEVRSTYSRIANGGAATGIPTMGHFFDGKVTAAVLEWLGIKRAPRPDYVPKTAYVWFDPEPLGFELLPVEPFSPELLPSSLRPLVEDVAERMQTPPDFAAAAALVTLAGCVNRRALIRPKRLDDWEETSNLWGAIIGPPGFLKSPTLRAITRPLVKIEELWRMNYQDAQQEYDAESEKSKLRHQAWTEQYKRSWKSGEPPPLEPDDSITAPTQPRLIVMDATFEKLHEILSQNPAGVISVRDELTGWLGELDKPGRESERGFYLQAWNGAGGFTVDRIQRGSVHVPHVCVSLIGGIQPARLRAYLAEALAGGPADDGLIQRFQIMVWPDANPEWQDVDRKPNQNALVAMEQVLSSLVKIPADFPAVLHFASDAQELFSAWRHELETKIRGNTLAPALVAHLSKYRGLLPRLAGLYELADRAAAGADLEGDIVISLEHIQQAAATCDYLESHARRVYACLTSPEMSAAQELGRHLKEGDLRNPFTLRDVYRHCWTGLSTPEKARAALALLADCDWVREQNSPTDPRGGRPTETWRINPKLEKWHGE